MSRDKESKSVPKVKLTRAEKKQLTQIMAQAKKPKHPQTAQQTIPYLRMYPDGLCRVTENCYSKTVRFHDINYQQAQEEDRQAIFGGWCGILNFFQPDVHVQFSFMNTQVNEAEFEKSLIIPHQNDGFDHVRDEFSSVLLRQVTKGNNALKRSKYITFSIEAESVRAAKTRLEQIELQLLNHLKRLGVQAESLDGKERLQLMHGMMHMDEPQTPFLFDWKWLPSTGLSTKDFIAPSSLYFKDSHQFMIGKKMATVSFMNILASELDDRVLVDFLSMQTTQVITMHVQSLDHVEAIKLVQRKLSDINRSKIDEQKKAVRSGYDIDILPTEMNSYVDSLTELLKRLTSHAERLFLMTFTLLHMGNPYIDAIVQQRDMTSLDTPANLMSKGITLWINYTAGSSTYLLPASAVRGSGDQRSVYTLKEVENSFGQIPLIVEEQPVTVLDESGDTVAVTGVPDHAKIAYMEDRAIGPGSEVMAYD